MIAMKRIWALFLLLMLLPVFAAAQVKMTELADHESGNRLISFEMISEEEMNPAVMAVNMQIQIRFEQEKAQKILGRAGAEIRQAGSLYQDGKIASMARTWQGEQADGTFGSSVAALTVSLETGLEIYLDELFADYEGAVAAMEAIIERDILQDMSGYLEYDDLLPMPTDCYAFDETGLTVYWPEDRYRYYSGESGSVTFYWHEIADYIGESSPAYELSRIKSIDAQALSDMIAQGGFDLLEGAGIGRKLGDAAQEYALGDPDYTTDALVYPLERMRGYALEIPKYAETDEEDTPLSAVRAKRISACGLTTGKTRPEELTAVFGEPQMTIRYDEDAALDAMLEPGESFFFAQEGNVLQAHFDENGLLSCLILRNAMPESLY